MHGYINVFCIKIMIRNYNSLYIVCKYVYNLITRINNCPQNIFFSQNWIIKFIQRLHFLRLINQSLNAIKSNISKFSLFKQIIKYSLFKFSEINVLYPNTKWQYVYINLRTKEWMKCNNPWQQTIDKSKEYNFLEYCGERSTAI